MIPGQTIIRECIVCGKHIAQQTLMSGNTFGARFWTDGKMLARMFPFQPTLVKCPHCDALVWINEQKKVREIDPREQRNNNDDIFINSCIGAVPSLQEYIDFINAGISTPNKERYVRIQIWWAGNDARRNSDDIKPLEQFEIQNLKALIKLLSENHDDSRLLKAEAFREIGKFNDAEKLLSSDFNERLLNSVRTIRDLNKKKISMVAEIKKQK